MGMSKSNGKITPAMRAVADKEFESLCRSQWEKKETSRERVGKRLEQLIKHAVTRVPFYRNRWKGPLPVRSLDGFALLERVPILTKRELIKVFPDGCLAEGVPELRRRLTFTSGSTGEPFRFYRDAAGRPMRIACQRLARQWAGIEPEDRQVWVGAPFDPRVSRQTIRERIKVFLGKEPPKFISVFDLSRRSVSPYLEQITRSRLPYILTGYTSALVLMAQEIGQRGLTLGRRPRCVIATAETVSPPHRRLIERSFGSRAINQYASWEFGTVGLSCPDVPDLMHLNAEWYVCEIVRQDGHPALSGEVGHLVITDLTNEVAPFIRYDTGDLVRVSDPCPCGRSWPTVAHIEGRTSDRITSRSGRVVFSSMIDHLLQIEHDYTPYLMEYQTIRRDESKLQFLYVPTSKWTPQIEDSLERDLQSFFGKDFTVAVKAVSEIPREASGKRPLVKSLEG